MLENNGFSSSSSFSKLPASFQAWLVQLEATAQTLPSDSFDTLLKKAEGHLEGSPVSVKTTVVSVDVSVTIPASTAPSEPNMASTTAPPPASDSQTHSVSAASKPPVTAVPLDAFFQLFTAQGSSFLPKDAIQDIETYVRQFLSQLYHTQTDTGATSTFQVKSDVFPLEIKISETSLHRYSITLRSTSELSALLSAHLSELAEHLRKKGIQVGQITVEEDYLASHNPQSDHEDSSRRSRGLSIESAASSESS